jgi:hypothetical protein
LLTNLLIARGWNVECGLEQDGGVCSNSWMNVTVFRRMLVASCWLPIAGLSVPIVLHAWSITIHPPQFLATGKIRAAPAKVLGMRSADELRQAVDASEKFYATEIERLESARLYGRASHRALRLHPEESPSDVEIRATRIGDSSIVTVSAIGPDAKFTHHFLDAVLDEYIELRSEEKRRSQAKNFDLLLYEHVTREQLAEALKVSEEAATLGAERARLASLVEDLQNLVALLKAASESTEAMEARLRYAEAKLTDVSSKFAAASELALALESRKQAHQNAQRELAGSKKAEGPTVRWVSETSVIMERPVRAVQTDRRTWPTLVQRGGLGWTGGLVLMIVFSAGVAMKAPAPTGHEAPPSQ